MKMLWCLTYPCGTAEVPHDADGRIYEMATEIRDGRRVAVCASAPGVNHDMGEPVMERVWVRDDWGE